MGFQGVALSQKYLPEDDGARTFLGLIDGCSRSVVVVKIMATVK